VLGPSGSERPGPPQSFGPRQRQGRFSPPSASMTCRQNRVVEWSESKPVGWRTRLATEERGGLTGAGGSIVVQIEWRGATVVEQRSSQGRRQGGGGSSRRWCKAQGGVGRFGGGLGRWFVVARWWQLDSAVAAKGQRRKRVIYGGGVLILYPEEAGAAWWQDGGRHGGGG
jgi:hypothetical protein